MHRGQQSLFTTLFPTSVTPSTDSDSKGERLFIDKRDDAIAYRYYFYVQIKRLRYDDCLLHLESDFFIGSRSIVMRLDSRKDLLKGLIKQDAKVNVLKKEFPQFNWN